VQHGHSLDGIDAAGQRIQPIRRDDDVFGERALSAVVAKAVAPDGVADAESVGGVADGLDDAHEIAADDKGKRRRRPISAGADQRVDVVHRERLRADEHV
jgi:hypothetical protein